MTKLERMRTHLERYRTDGNCAVPASANDVAALLEVVKAAMAAADVYWTDASCRKVALALAPFLSEQPSGEAP